MEINVVNTSKGFVPLNDADLDLKKRLKLGQTYTITITQQRNVGMVIRFNKLLETTFENQEKYLSKDALQLEMMLRAGFGETKTDSQGNPYPSRVSTNFEEMDEFKFRDVYNRVLDEIVKEFSYDRELIENEINEFL